MIAFIVKKNRIQNFAIYKKNFFMAKTSKIEVYKKSISIIEQNHEDYVCLTDMVRGEEGEDHIRNWMRTEIQLSLSDFGKPFITQILNLSNSTPLENKQGLTALI